MNALGDAWARRSPTERMLLAALAVVVGTALLIALVWLPLERERTRLQRELPALRASIDALEGQKREVLRLRSLPAIATTASTAPLASLATNAGGLAGASITVLDPRRVRVAGPDVGYIALLDWLRGAQATHGMHVESAHLEALPARGRVRVEMLLAKD